MKATIIALFISLTSFCHAYSDKMIDNRFFAKTFFMNGQTDKALKWLDFYIRDEKSTVEDIIHYLILRAKIHLFEDRLNEYVKDLMKIDDMVSNDIRCLKELKEEYPNSWSQYICMD